MKRKILFQTFVFFLLIEILNSKIIKGFDIQDYSNFESIQQDELISSIDDFINLPKGGVPWKVFGDTGMDEYTFTDEEGNDWLGFRPLFTKEIKKLDAKEILVQGYMFPLDQGEGQSLFLLGPFPLTCPYHPHTSSNLTIEVSAKIPITFSYEPVNVKGQLELVPKDDLYNVFFRLKNAELVPD